ncbi:MAG: acyclic terpene utilization AtuA family protein [Mycobacteriales bacterium]|nr:acyclic terpene utilization AtuA family protein [Mycobacteriales bacterium]
MDVLRIANCSGFYGDRLSALSEVVNDGPVDVVTGDYLAELTMLILWRSRLKDPAKGYATTFLRQLEGVLGTVADRGTRVVVNAGGLAPAACADAVRALAERLGVPLAVSHVEGDDVLERLAELDLQAMDAVTLDGRQALTANTYLGAWGIATALDAGAQVVVTGRVTDASLVVGPAASHFGWARDDWDRLAGAVVIGHVLECGTQATGGNYSFVTEEVAQPLRMGFPVAEVAADGSAVVTKHPGTGGAVTVGTVTAQLLYEISSPLYAGPDVVTDFSTIAVTDDGPDRVRLSGVRGQPPTGALKVCVNALGGFRNRMDLVLTGLDVEAKAELAMAGLRDALPVAPAVLEHRLVRLDREDAPTNEQAVALLRVSAKDPSADPVGRAFSSAAVELALGSYPGFTLTAPPGDAQPYGVYVPLLVPASHAPLVEHVVVHHDGRRELVAHTPGRTTTTTSSPAPAPVAAGGPTRRVPLGTVVGARSGDKGGNANIGLWARTDAAADWLLGWLDEAQLRVLLPEADGLAVQVFALPNLRAVNVVVHGLLGEGVASSTRFDPQAKGLGEYLRSRHVDVPVHLLP